MDTSYNVNGAFERNLENSMLAPCWKPVAENNAQSLRARELQKLLDGADPSKTIQEGKFTELDNKIKSYANENHFFILTEGRFTEVVPGDPKEVTLKIQVKEGTITWYFAKVGHDETTQEFRNQVFRTAALGHYLVSDACAKYYRGTNAMHVIRMHTSENESFTNHNHYRIKNEFVTPSQFEEHLNAFIQAEEAYGIKDKFLDNKEASKLSKEYSEFCDYLNKQPDPNSQKTNREIYRELEQQKWTEMDILELQSPDAQEENPCEAVTIEIPLNFEAVTLVGKDDVKLTFLPKEWPKFKDVLGKDALDILAKQGSSGMKSDIAHTRQIEDSKFPKLKNAYTRLGELFEKEQYKGYPKIPESKRV